ncbi:1-ACYLGLYCEROL-3-PHOSPHATE ACYLTRANSFERASE-RELATED [Salix koriyanagi]|uniref:1-ACYLGLYCEROL-3-PHOSPHATE ACYLTRANSFERASE-RELATED n=1 Tax=Salix koriyanagi TaxID=2511006 RepID=A0A9Q0TDY1_9ROSI|nr:1-ACYLGLYCEROL-3-PHOSPHATE ACYLTRANSFERASE-RELATED [Salix koriyanagi]
MSLEFISVERNWEVDEPVMHQMLSTFKDPQDPLWLALFPEGTDFRNARGAKSLPMKLDFPCLRMCYFLKQGAFCLCLEVLRGSLDAVYDVSIAYKHQLPTFLDNVFGSSSRIVCSQTSKLTAISLMKE